MAGPPVANLNSTPQNLSTEAKKENRHRRQLGVLLILLLGYALAAFVTYAFFLEVMVSSLNVPYTDMGVPPFVLGLANAGIALVAYGLIGLIGYGFACQLNLPGIFSPEGNWRRWVLIPMGIGLLCGLALAIGDILFAPFNGFGRLVHPPFPLSIVASLSAGIGEEIAFRGLVFGLWAFILNALLRRWQGRAIALWAANVLAALAFGAGHLGTLMLLTGASSIADLNPVLLAEVFVLNGLIGLMAGERYVKDGLVAAAGVHFWTDVVFHVLWGLL